MKKTIVILAAGALALSACTSIGVVEEGVQGGAIGFSNAVKKETRALTNESLQNFYVYGYYTKNSFEANPVNVFSNVKVKKEGNAWGYDNTRYWVPDTKYYFYAYSCDNNAVSAANGTPSLNLTGATVNSRALRITDYICNESHQDDLIFAYAEEIEGLETGNSPVSFKFQHILTKINVVFNSAFAPGYDIEVSNVKIVNIRDKGTYNPKATTVWGTPTRSSNTEGEEPCIELSISGGNIASAKNGEIAAKNVTTEDGYVIPYKYTDSNVWLEFEILVKKDEVEVLNQILQGTWAPQWESGKSYTYNVTISGSEAGLQPIVFQTAEDMNLDEWNSGSTESVDMNFEA